MGRHLGALMRRRLLPLLRVFHPRWRCCRFSFLFDDLSFFFHAGERTVPKRILRPDQPRSVGRRPRPCLQLYSVRHLILPPRFFRLLPFFFNYLSLSLLFFLSSFSHNEEKGEDKRNQKHHQRPCTLVWDSFIVIIIIFFFASLHFSLIRIVFCRNLSTSTRRIRKIRQVIREVAFFVVGWHLGFGLVERVDPLPVLVQRGGFCVTSERGHFVFSWLVCLSPSDSILVCVFCCFYYLFPSA